MYRAGIFRQSMGARNRVGIGLSYRPARLHKLVESIPGLHKSLKIPALIGLIASHRQPRILRAVSSKQMTQSW